MEIIKKIRVSMAAFAYVLFAISPAMADDSEIYIGGVTSGTVGNPNVMLLIDTSGSMAWSMYSASETSNEASKRYTHLKNATRQILSTLPGNINVGLSRYNSDGNGGRVIYPLTALSAPANANADGSQDRNFVIKNAEIDDVQQTGASSSTLVTTGSRLTVGGVNLSPIVMTSSSDGSVQCRAQTTQTFTPAPYVGSGSSIKGLYLNNHPTPNTSNTSNSNPPQNPGKNKYCESNLGLRFITPTTGVIGSDVASATLVLTHAGSPNSQPSGWSGTVDGNDPITLRVYVESSLNPNTYTTSSANRVNDRSYVSTSYVDVSIGEDEFVVDGEELRIDVTALVRNRVAAGLVLGNAIAFKVEGRSGNGSYGSGNSNNPLIRRIYGRHDSATKAPRLELTMASSTPTNEVGLRFSNFDIPKGSTINSARLVLTAAANSAGADMRFNVRSDATSSTYINSLPFDTTNHLGLSARWGSPVNSSSLATSPSNNWTKDTEYSLDVKDLVQNQVEDDDFCGATELAGDNAIGFLLKAASSYSGARVFHSSEGDKEKAPRLVVNFTAPTGNSCMQVRRNYSTGSSDDVSQSSSSSNNSLVDSKIQFVGSNHRAGLRFGSIQVPKNAVIVSARLTLQATNTPSSSNRGTITIKAIDTADLSSFTNTSSGRLSNMSTTGSVGWSPTEWTSGREYESTNIASLVQAIVNKSSWASGNAMGFILQGSTSNGPQFYTFDGRVSAAPRLTIIYRSTDVNDAVYTSRQALIDTIDGLSFTGGTPLNETYYETAKYMLAETAYYGRANPTAVSGFKLYPDSAKAMNSSNLYQSPVGQASCQSNNVILLTDGLPSADFDAVSKGTVCSAPANVGTVDGNANTSDSFTCMKNTAKYLYETGRNGVPVKTYTIGFGPVTSNPSGMASRGLTAVAQAGGGAFFSAADSDALTASFQTIFARISDANGTQASPGVAVNQLNRSQHLDQLYYGVFKPQTVKRWPGNVKRYRLNDEIAVVDKLGSYAIDNETKYFDVNAKSWWSSEVDGNDATKGGAAEKQSSALTVYMDSGSAGSMTVLNAALPPAGLSSDDVKWIQGYDVDNENGQGATGFRQSMGSPIHSQPTLVAYGNGTEDFVVFTSTNDGLLHSVNVSDGTHNWAWLPNDLKGNVPELRENAAMAAGGTPIYGLDGSWTVVKLPGNGGTLLVGGMRQGGSNYYAIQLPTTKTGAPKLKWVIRPSDLSRLGYTWSQPTFTYIRKNSGGVSEIVPVVVFGGGLDYSKYEGGGASTVAGSGTDLGNAVYMVDARNGSLIWWGSSSAASSSNSTRATAMKYSVPGRVRAVDKNADGLADHLYVGDIGGQIFRVDIDNRKTATKLVKRIALLAQLGGAEATGKINDRRFYEQPGVAYVQDNDRYYAAVTIGSGDRNYPKSNKDTEDRFFMIKDYDAGRFDILDDENATDGGMTETGDGKNGVPDLATFPNPFRTADLADVTTKTGSAATTALLGKKGWYITLPRAGEKVLSSPLVFSESTDTGLNYKVFFNSFVADSSSSSSCSPVAGSTSSWSVLLANGAAVKDLNNDGKIDESDRYRDSVVNGISGSDVGIIREGADGKLDLQVLTGTKGESGGEPPPGLNNIGRTRWYDKRSSPE